MDLWPIRCKTHYIAFEDISQSNSFHNQTHYVWVGKSMNCSLCSKLFFTERERESSCGLSYNWLLCYKIT